MKLRSLLYFSRLALSLLFIAALLSPSRAAAQSSGLYYTVQPGDTLSGIANSFHTSTGRLLTLNYMPDPNNLGAGVTLYIPGFEDVQGEAMRVELPVGQSLAAYNQELHLPAGLLDRMNFITNPDAFYAGQRYYKINQAAPKNESVPVTAGLLGLELAVKRGVNPWVVSEYNTLRAPWALVPNGFLFFPASAAPQYTPLLPGVTNLSISPVLLPQGKTIQFQADLSQTAQLAGTLGAYTLHFFPNTETNLTALQGIPRLADPGLVPFTLTATLADGSTFSIQQNLLVVENNSYGADTPFQVADNYVDPAVTEPELALVMQQVAAAPPEKTWNGAFKSPSPTPDCLTSTFGRLRSYNGSPYTYFHSGLDYCGIDKTPIYAAASGTVVYTGALTVRGNATIISHGWGVYTGYWHQSKINVSVGDFVEAGRVIGMVGNTGRVTGPHLHFEVFVGGVQVDPTEWLQGMY
jgi:murein DD-endopeptidase MepM/ murein hydrolase activator NlpD